MAELNRILLVEDDPNDVELTLSGLAEYNLANEVVIAQDGEEALDYLFRRGKFASRPGGNPAVVLLDLKLPKVGGLEVLRSMKGDENLKLVPVVILTSSREERDMVEGYELGTNAYVVKPVDFHQFVEAIRLIGAFWAVVNEPPPGRAA
ncbi:MAG TPA: response regulator [Thermodesulfovibrionales bacterium]|nr:response regulator [Thermodesulfovibrionales bacterium]